MSTEKILGPALALRYAVEQAVLALAQNGDPDEVATDLLDASEHFIKSYDAVYGTEKGKKVERQDG